MTRQNWSRDELIIAFNLYCKIPFGRIHNRNPQIIELAYLLGRTPSAVAYKLANFAHLDPDLHRQGASHVSKLDIAIWEEFHKDWTQLSFESEKLIAQFKHQNIEEVMGFDELNLPKEGKEREAVVKVRVNQSFFRSTVLAAYDYCCCITGLGFAELLNASHILPWSKNIEHRVNPRNGLCLNSLHDRAFDRGLLTITPNLTVLLSGKIRTGESINTKNFFTQFDGRKIQLPRRFLPDPEFLEYHNKYIFLGV